MTLTKKGKKVMPRIGYQGWDVVERGVELWSSRDIYREVTYEGGRKGKQNVRSTRT